MVWPQGFLYFFAIDEDGAVRWFKNPPNFDDPEIVIYDETLWRDF